ncbi:MAG TPA: hypothetical protein DEQ02_08135 [Ruminococcaceae bacterium]|nr:hypothetical protein [Oscillospiraceae bacterium]
MQIIDFLDAGLESALICRAIDESVNAGARNWVYARSILDACVTKGLLTLSQYTLSEANRRAYKARQNGGITSGYDSAGTAYAPSGGELGAAVGGDTDELREGFKRQSDKWRRKAD